MIELKHYRIYGNGREFFMHSELDLNEFREIILDNYEIEEKEK